MEKTLQDSVEQFTLLDCWYTDGHVTYVIASAAGVVY